ncbi:hypothetical protein SYNTR_2140 [Candidatus Syntrophocurvum alkaliphilum]|uniref:Uncharacterized protein n=1 Tax=Candidatus Syntrophocurvum alkaliphilum TaxID=2293317 RepID=A0A6I6DIQ7_9FIRM|nr:hypothetical protein [Candidatus Syntrophocurvum alkaliphilum]QGU00734.1 hypothetical protein SYNTR_2140 [Candidatus Syntrophocurvum alkaliphilum]
MQTQFLILIALIILATIIFGIMIFRFTIRFEKKALKAKQLKEEHEKTLRKKQ